MKSKKETFGKKYYKDILDYQMKIKIGANKNFSISPKLSLKKKKEFKKLMLIHIAKRILK